MLLFKKKHYSGSITLRVKLNQCTYSNKNLNYLLHFINHLRRY